MILTKTPICNFGEKVKDFSLPSTNNEVVKFSDIKGENGTLIMFICNHCPYVLAIIDDLIITIEKLKKFKIGCVAIMPNDVTKYPEDNFEKMKELASKKRFSFPYLLDESQDTAKIFKAVCTPDFFGYNKSDKLQYRGRYKKLVDLKFTDSDKNELFESMIMISKTGNGPKTQYPSMGCSIKWK
ncbi:MAG: thioredoxin family protein [Rickettsiales bacterium]|nr:thioredoxin family protein [Rickettsiales bacterium]|tara:strand:+ start:4045 stop:4596 length:552 start_codon:yes stop_codon:yes gene_type:complete